MNATMPFDFTICPLNGEPFKIDATDLVTVKDLKSVLQERYQGDSVSRKLVTMQFVKDERVIEDHEALKDIDVHDQPGMSVIYGRNIIETAERDHVAGMGWSLNSQQVQAALLVCIKELERLILCGTGQINDIATTVTGKSFGLGKCNW